MASLSLVEALIQEGSGCWVLQDHLKRGPNFWMEKCEYLKMTVQMNFLGYHRTNFLLNSANKYSFSLNPQRFVSFLVILNYRYILTKTYKVQSKITKPQVNSLLQCHIIQLSMKDNKKETMLRKSKRVLSDFQPMQNRFKNIDQLYEEYKFQKRKPNTIKINKNKLPADFFPHTQSMRKKFDINRPSLQDQKERFQQLRSESEKKCFPPDRTSFFGFFDEKQKNKRPTGYSLNVKRQFQTRDEPKRDKMYFEPRNLTPMINPQKSQILEMFPVSHDQMTYDAILNSKKIKGIVVSPIKQLQNTIKQQSYLISQDSQKFLTRRQNFKQIVNLSPPQNSHQITFFNVKSTSFPPIFKNNSICS